MDFQLHWKCWHTKTSRKTDIQSFKLLSELTVTYSTCGCSILIGSRHQRTWQPCFRCCYFCQLPNRFIELSSCLCIKTQNMVASGTFSAAFYLTTADKINGEKTELGPSWLAILELHSPRWITYLGSLARHKDHVCGSWKSVGVPLLRIWPSVFYVVGDICFTSPGVSSMPWCGFASFPSFACCHKEYLQ